MLTNLGTPKHMALGIWCAFIGTGLAFDPAPLPDLLSPPACALVAVIVCPAASAPTVAIRALYKAAHTLLTLYLLGGCGSTRLETMPLSLSIIDVQDV